MSRFHVRAADNPATAPTAAQAALRAEFEAAKKGAQAGDVVAMRTLGSMYNLGVVGPADPVKAAEWFGKAADKGDWQAMQSMARAYQRGLGVTLDPARAEELDRTWRAGRDKAAEASEPAAMMSMARTNHYGDATHPNNLPEAVRWYRKAAGAGVAEAMMTLAAFHRQGDHVPKDLEAAVTWYRKAASAGSADAMTELGVCYAAGQGVARDDKTAADWFRKAADKGNDEAMLFLALCSESGRGVPRDSEAVERRFHQAAEAGNAAAAFLLGAPTPAATAAMERVLPDIKLAALGLGDALEFFGDLTGQDIVVDWADLNTVHVTRETVINSAVVKVRFRDALETVLALASAGAKDGASVRFVVNGDCVLIATDRKLEAREAHLKSLRASLARCDWSVLRGALRPMADAHFEATELHDVFDFCRDVSGILFDARWEKLGGGIARQTPLTVKIHHQSLIVCLDLFQFVLHDGVTFVAEDGKIVVKTP
jgi:TPR repeat protein